MPEPAVDLGPSAERLKTLLAGVADDHLTARTPCEEYSVGDLLDHLMGLTAAFQNAATKDTGPAGSTQPPGSATVSAAHLDPQWRAELPARLDRLVAAWRESAAWVGDTEAGGVTMPATVMGLVATNEITIHGWDLARATGQSYVGDMATARALVGFLGQAGDGDGEGLFGPVVDVPPDASPLDRAVGLCGRDPSWTP